MITRDQKQILEPVAIVLAGIEADLDSKEDDELESMLEACDATSQTNCWCWTYAAAQYMRPILQNLIEQRKRNR